VGNFTNEEGCRFHTDMLGSAVATGRLPLDEAWRLEDSDGRSIEAELKRIGFLGDADPLAMRPHAYVECHVEQGPVLGHAGVDVGVVTGVQAISWYELALTGNACHAGATPMELRRDPAAAAARVLGWVQEMATSGTYGEAMRATVGSLRALPGAINVVPARVEATVDMRNPSDADLERAERDMLAFLDELAEGSGVQIEQRRIASTPAVPFDAHVRELIAACADSLDLSHRHILSGAGHDAQEWARIVKTAMVFVPGQHDGISHNPREHSTPEQCAAGVNVLLRTLLALAEEE
jgi:N-carbamoyl-L-amino-acid hydrolase